jgi:hypothetical protein
MSNYVLALRELMFLWFYRSLGKETFKEEQPVKNLKDSFQPAGKSRKRLNRKAINYPTREMVVDG